MRLKSFNTTGARQYTNKQGTTQIGAARMAKNIYKVELI